MSQTIIIKRSNSTVVVPGTTSLAFGEIVFTEIGGIKSFYIGDSSNLAQLVAGDAYALLDSPTFVGNPTVPTAVQGDNSTTIANTAFVTIAVQAAQAGLDVKQSVYVATTIALPAVTAAGSGIGKTLTADANCVLSIDGINSAWVDIDNDGGSTDPYVANAASRVLIKNQAIASDNGIYAVQDKGSISSPFILIRAIDFDDSATVSSGAFTFAEEGTLNTGAGFVLTTPNPIVIDTDNLTFAQFSGAGSITAGNGLTKSGNTISALSDTIGGANLSRSVNVSANGLAVKVDNTTISENGSSQLYVPNGGITENQINTSSLSTTGGLTGGSGSKIAILPDVTTGATVTPIAISANGAGVAIDNASLIQTAGVMSVGTIDCGTF
jgi:hypothetical protein